MPHTIAPPNAVDLAEQALRHFAEADVTRDEAARLLPIWSGRWMLTAAEEVALLQRFPRFGRRS